MNIMGHNSDGFNWQRAVVAQQDAIAIYTNEDGGIVIRQHNWPDDDSYIIVARNNVEKVAGAMMAEAGLTIPVPAQVLLPAPKDPTAAERQKRYRDRHGNADRNGHDRNGTVMAAFALAAE
jgi:hypothetical protein